MSADRPFYELREEDKITQDENSQLTNGLKKEWTKEKYNTPLV